MMNPTVIHEDNTTRSNNQYYSDYFQTDEKQRRPVLPQLQHQQHHQRPINGGGGNTGISSTVSNRNDQIHPILNRNFSSASNVTIVTSNRSVVNDSNTVQHTAHNSYQSCHNNNNDVDVDGNQSMTEYNNNNNNHHHDIDNDRTTTIRNDTTTTSERSKLLSRPAVTTTIDRYTSGDRDRGAATTTTTTCTTWLAILASTASIFLCSVAILSWFGGFSYFSHNHHTDRSSSDNDGNNNNNGDDVFQLLRTSRWNNPIIPSSNATTNITATTPSSSSMTTTTTTTEILQQQQFYYQHNYDTFDTTNYNNNNGESTTGSYRYIVKDYDTQPNTATSRNMHQLPGLVGIYGIAPLVGINYIHRGQAIVSFGGFHSRHDPIMTTTSITTSTPQQVWSLTPLTGFRTFLQMSKPHPQPVGRMPYTLYQRWKDRLFRLFWGNHFGNDSSNRAATAEETILIEPFSPLVSQYNENEYDTMEQQQRQQYRRHMYIGNNMIQLQEIDVVHAIETNVTFFLLPEEDFGAFVKRTTITNIAPRSDFDDTAAATITLSILDGLTNIMPAGVIRGSNRGFVDEDVMIVDSPYDNKHDDVDAKSSRRIEMPFYRSLTMVPPNGDGDGDDVDDSKRSTTPTVSEYGHWCLSIFDDELATTSTTTTPKLLPIVYDPSIIFGDDTTLLRPLRLQQVGHTISDMFNNIAGKEQHHQSRRGKVPSAFAALTDVTLTQGQSITITTFFGTANHILDVPVIARRLLQPGFASFKMNRATELIRQVTSSVESSTSNPVWDKHVQQMFLYNALNNGVGTVQIVGEDNDDSKLRCTDEDERLKVLHLFSSVDNQEERDDAAPTFFANGYGNFRDVVQGRRNDVFFNPRIGSFNVKTFLSFIQADGYEPSTIESILFKIDNIDDCIEIATLAVGEADGHRAQRTALTNILYSGLFRPGQLFQIMMEQNIELVISRQEFIDIVTAVSRVHPSASYGSGFWADHWTYYMDVVDTYLSIYPEWEKRIFFEEQLPYFSSPVSLKPRSKKYVLLEKDSDKKLFVRQLKCIVIDESDTRQHFASTNNWDVYKTNWQHGEDGLTFKSSPMEKLFLLAMMKFAARDPYGVGLLYEGGKPGWNGGTSGLVNLIGSGTPEVYELYVLLKFVKATVKKYEIDINIPIELHRFLISINTALDKLQQTGYVDGKVLYPKVPEPLFNYWNDTTTALEVYRKQVEQTFIGKTHELNCDELDSLLKRCLEEIELGIERGRKLGTHGKCDDGSSCIPPTYFTYDVVKWTLTGERSVDGHSFVFPLEMEVNLLPMFLEGPARYFKTINTKDDAKILYSMVRTSPLRDPILPMYTISASLTRQSSELGRVTAIPAGWLENQSIWLQMSYKYYFELLRHGLYEEFFMEMESGGMLPYFDPKVYGHSLVDCTTFVVSSVYNDDPSMRGRGYNSNNNYNDEPSQQPFSCGGATSELLSIWIYIMIGPKPFFLHDTSGALQLRLQPTIPLSWFYDNGPDDDDDDTSSWIVRYKLFGSMDVTYYNNRRIDLFDIVPSRYVVTLRDGTVVEVLGPIIDDTALADKIRRIVFVATLEVYF